MTTKRVTLTNEWVEIGVGPAYVEADRTACVTFGPSLPLAESKAFHRLGPILGRHPSYGGTDKIFAQKKSRLECNIVITEVR